MIARRTAASQIVFLIILAAPVLDVTPAPARDPAVTGAIRKLYPQQGDRIAAGTRFQCGYDVGPIKVVERGDHKLLKVWTYAKVRTVKDRRVVCERRGGASPGIQLDQNWISHELSGQCSPVQLEAGRYEYVFIVVAQLDDEAPIILDVRTERFRAE